MQPYIAVTHPKWFQFLRELAGKGGRLDEVNFWNPGGTPLKRFTPGDPVFFRLKAPYGVIAGYGFFAYFSRMPLATAWDCFGPKNGAAHLGELAARLGALSSAIRKRPQAEIGCTMLRDAVFWPEARRFPWGEAQGWKHNGPNRGKAERDPALASRLLQEIQYDHLDPPGELAEESFHLLDADERVLQLAETRPREGQGVFRSRLLDVYGGRCAITGEHTEIVLDAAHIQPYLGPRSNHLQNGLLLTKEFHTLFDAGFVTVTPEYEVRVSPRLRERWDNGRRYYPVDGRRLLVVPQGSDTRPSPEVLAWHNEKIFLG